MVGESSEVSIQDAMWVSFFPDKLAAINENMEVVYLIFARSSDFPGLNQSTLAISGISMFNDSTGVGLSGDKASPDPCSPGFQSIR